MPRPSRVQVQLGSVVISLAALIGACARSEFVLGARDAQSAAVDHGNDRRADDAFEAPDLDAKNAKDLDGTGEFLEDLGTCLERRSPCAAGQGPRCCPPLLCCPSTTTDAGSRCKSAC